MENYNSLTQKPMLLSLNLLCVRKYGIVTQVYSVPRTLYMVSDP